MIISHWESIFCIRCIYCFPYMFECGCPHKYQINQLLLKRELYWFFCVIFAGVKNLVWIIVAMMVLGAVVPGCDDVPRYDGRLTAADSLIHDHADSALTMLEALTPSDLATEGDRAYHDLLLTQTRYKCYRPATSDSAINRALAYYRAHPKEREKLTRAYIYKGTVMEELGHPDSALFYYIYTETNVSPDDYFNLGYVKLRIAFLYQDQLSQDSTAIIRLHDALHYFTLCQDTSMIITSLGALGSICGDLFPDSAIIYLNQAIELARLSNPRLQYSPKSTLAGILLFKREYGRANELAMDIIRNGMEYCDETQFYYYAALSYIRMGKIDSAKAVMQIMPSPVDAVDSITFFNLAAELNAADGDYKQYAQNLARSKNISIRILSSSKEEELILTESNYIQMQNQEHNRVLRQYNSSLMTLIILAIVIIIGITILAVRLKNRIQSIKNEAANIKKELEQIISNLKKEKEVSKGIVSDLVSLRISAIQELYRDIRLKSTDEDKVKKIISLNSMLKSLNDKKLFMSLNIKNTFWEKMRLSVDGEYKGILTFVEKNYPDLTDDDLKLFCLLCAKISPQIIRLCMKYDNPKTVTNYRSKIIRKRMGLDMSFDEFVNEYMNENLEKLINRNGFLRV